MKRNQVMITALAVMIAIAGYLNFAGNKMNEEALIVSDDVMTEDEMTALLDLSEEDIVSDIDSLDEDAVLTGNYLEEDIILGENASKSWRDVICFIPLFLCNEKQELFSISCISKIFTEEEFEHFEVSIKDYIEKKTNTYRDGFKTLIKY